MLEFRCTEEGFVYYDPILHSYITAPNTLLFLIGYARVFGDTKVSDKLFIPHSILDSEGKLVALPNLTFFTHVREYLNTISKVECLDTGDLFELYGLTQALEQIGFFTYYSSSTPYNAHLNRVPHVPLFTKRSQDYKRIYDILTIKTYWNTDEENQTPDAGKAEIEPLYTIYNMEYKGNRGEFLDLYKSFGSSNYINNILYPTEPKPVDEYADYCSWFVWDSLAFTQLYQFSLGVLYGMSLLGWGFTPYMMRPKEYSPDFKYLQYIDEAFFWFQNTPLELTGRNELINVSANLFRIDTYPSTTSGRILSSSVDQDYLVNSFTGLFSVDNGSTWMNREEFEQWASEHDGALPVTDYTTSLYRGSQSLSLPLSDWEW